MKKLTCMVALLLVVLTTSAIDRDAPEYDVAPAASFQKPSKHTLWYTRPAANTYAQWQEYSLPIGNGELGGSIFGGIRMDKITFNEKSLWDGASTTRPNPNHGEYLKFGSLWVEDLGSALSAGVKDYVRYLDIDNAVAGVSFADANGTRYTRTCISSQPDKVMAIRYEAQGANTMSLRFAMQIPQQLNERSQVKPQIKYSDRGGSYGGKLELLSYCATFAVKADKRATISATDQGIEVKGAREIVLYIAAGTDFDAYNYDGFTNGTAAQLPAIMASRIDAASKKKWAQMLKAHVADYRQYADRVNLDFKVGGASVDSRMTTKDLIDAYGYNADGFRNTAQGLYLEQLYYNYGRYLMIASNRHQPVPNNLQGLWVDTDRGHAPWNSDIHTNINIQMNYWPAEPCNLSDLHMPLLDHIVSISQSPGAKAQAKKAGQSVGWVVDTESNLFGGMSSWSDNYTIANAWYVTHLWQHYRYTLDTAYLRRVFPAMWSAAQYWAERLVEAEDGTYECPAEFSPEHGPQAENATAHSQQLVVELFSNTLAAIDVLGNAAELDAQWLAKIRDRYQKADRGLAIETYTGDWGTKIIPAQTPVLREWKYSPYTVGQNAHRHTSHLMALYPFSQITPHSPYFKPAINSLAQRTDASTGWAMGWRVNLWARALDGNHARRMINNALCHAGDGLNYSSGGVYYNLWDAHTPFQIDGNFGVTAGIAEMLMQSGTGTISLLPALPNAWAEGSITGLKAVGNFTIDESWTNGRLATATIRSHAGAPLRVHYAQRSLAEATVTDAKGRALKLQAVEGEPNTYEITLPAGATANIKF